MARLALCKIQFFRHRIRLLSTAVADADADADDVNAIFRVLKDHRSPHHDLESALLPFASTLTPSLLESALNRCGNHPSAAHRLFLFASSLPNFTPSSLSHRLLLRSLASRRQFPLAWAHLSDHRHHCADHFDVLFFAYSKAKLPSEAIRAFNKMPDFGLTPSLAQLDLLLLALCRYGHVSEAHSFFHSVKARFPITNKTYTILIQGWAATGQSKHASDLFDEMRQRESSSCIPDVLACNALVEALCKGRDLIEAGRRLKEMRTVYGLEPNVGSYAVFVRAYCEMKDPHSAFKVMDNMKKKGLAPNLYIYNCVIGLLCESEEKEKEVYRVLDEMLERGVKPDVWTYNRILSVHCKLRESNKALKVFKRMDENGCLPDRHTYNMLMKMLLGVGKIDHVVAIWDGMEGRGFYPEVCSYAVMIHGLCKLRGRAAEASRYFEMMIDEGIPPNAKTCVLLRSVLWRQGLKAKVEALTDKMWRNASKTIQELSSVMETGKELPRIVRD